MSSSNRKNTLISMGLGVGALVFAFFMVLGDPQQGPQMMAQGGQIIKQIQESTANIGKQDQTALAPESRLDMTMNTPGGNGMNDLSVRSGAGDNSKSSVDDYLDGAWGSPQASQQAQMMPQQQQHFRAPQQQRSFGFGRHSGFGQRGMPQGGFRQGGQGMGDFRQMMKEMNGGGAPGAAPNNNSARGAVQYELDYARNQASQARGCLNRARDAQERSEKQSAASEARSHASQAYAAASRAASRASGVSELQGLVSQARNFASQADNAANEAASAANSGW